MKQFNIFSKIHGIVQNIALFIKGVLTKQKDKDTDEANIISLSNEANIISLSILRDTIEEAGETYKWTYIPKTDSGKKDEQKDISIVSNDAKKIVDTINSVMSSPDFNNNVAGNVLKKLSDFTGMTGRDLSKWIIDLVYALYEDRYRPQPYSTARTDVQKKQMKSIIKEIENNKS